MRLGLQGGVKDWLKRTALGGGPWRGAHWLALAVVLLGFGLRVHQVGQDALWYDEVLQVRVGEAPTFRSFLGRLRRYPMAVPLDWLTTRLAARLGQQEFFLRAPAALWGVVAVAGAYRVGRLAAGRRAGLLAALLTALWAFHVRYSQEVRNYASLSAFYLLGTAALIEAVRRPASRGRWLAAGTLLWVGSYFHAYVLFALANGYAAWLAAPLERGERGIVLRRLLGVSVAVGLLFLPAYYFFGRGSFGVELYEHGRTFWRVLGLGLGWLGLRYDGEAAVFGLWEAVVAVGLAAGLTGMALRPARGRWLWALAAGTAAQVALIYLGDIWRSYWFLSRQLVHLAPGMFVVAGAGLASLTETGGRSLQGTRLPARRLAGWLLAGVGLLALAGALPNLRSYYTYPRTTARDIARLLVERQQPGEPIYVAFGYEALVYAYYLERLPGGEQRAADLHRLELDQLGELAEAPGTVYLALTPRATEAHYAQIEALGFRPLYRWPGNWLVAQSLFVREIGYN